MMLDDIRPSMLGMEKHCPSLILEIADGLLSDATVGQGLPFVTHVIDPSILSKSTIIGVVMLDLYVMRCSESFETVFGL